MFPNARVDVLIIRQVVSMPSLIVIGFWIVLQLFSGVGSIANTDETSNAGGVAYMAHVGGFAAGLAVAFLFSRRAADHRKRRNSYRASKRTSRNPGSGSLMNSYECFAPIELLPVPHSALAQRPQHEHRKKRGDDVHCRRRVEDRVPASGRLRQQT